MVCAQQNVPAKSFKVCKILCIRKFMGFPLHKILKYFNGTFCWALTSYFWWLFMYQKTVPGIIRHATSRAKIVFRKFDNNSGWAAGWLSHSKFFFQVVVPNNKTSFFVTFWNVKFAVLFFYWELSLIAGWHSVKQKSVC